MANYSLIYKLYFASVYILVSIIIALIVIQIPLRQQIEEARIEKEKIFESYGQILQSTYWGADSNVWWFKARSKLSDCPDFFTLDTLQSSFALPCIPQTTPQIQKFPWIKILGIDATFVDDNIDFVDVRKYFNDNGSVFYSTQSPGRFPGSGVVRTTSPFIFGWKKILYIFYNERKAIKKYKREAVIKWIKNHFPDLDEVRLHSFFYYRKALWSEPFESDLGRLLYYIWDCKLPEHSFCSNELTTDGKYQLFTQDMVGEDLDFFFIVPANMQQNNMSFETSSWPKVFLQWLFKSSN